MAIFNKKYPRKYRSKKRKVTIYKKSMYPKRFGKIRYGKPGYMPALGMSNVHYCKLIFTATAADAHTSGAPARLLLSGNGISNVTGAMTPGESDRPDFYSTYATIYQQYEVIGSKILVSVATAGTLNMPLQLAVRGIGDSRATVASTGAIDAVAEGKLPNSRLKTASMGGDPKYIKMYFNSKKLLQINDIQGLSGTADPAASLPGKEWTWSITSTPVDGGTSQSGIITVKIIYYVRWYDLINRNDS